VQAFGGRAVSLWGLPVHEGDVGVLTGRGRSCISVGYWPARGEISGVMPDNFGGAYELGRRVVAFGHREMAFMGTRRTHGAEGSVGVGSDARERLSGCRVAWEEAGIELARSHMIGAAATDDWLADRVLSLKPRPTVIVVSEQKLAEALMKQLKERGVSVPRGLSVACFGAKGEPNTMDMTSMRVDWAQAGQCTWARLRELQSGAPVERLRIGLPFEFHEGRTMSGLA
jgi:DNA-binding LacI/PurR family transcriptional regulator